MERKTSFQILLCHPLSHAPLVETTTNCANTHGADMVHRCHYQEPVQSNNVQKKMEVVHVEKVAARRLKDISSAEIHKRIKKGENSFLLKKKKWQLFMTHSGIHLL